MSPDEKVMNEQTSLKNRKCEEGENVDEFVECSICLDQKSKSDIMKLRCTHELCRVCMLRLVKEESAIGKFPPACPMCRGGISDEDLQECMNENMFEAYDYIRNVSKEKKKDDFFSCRTPGCRNGVLVEDNLKIWRCGKCQHQYCVLCGREAHNRTCHEYDTFLRGNQLLSHSVKEMFRKGKLKRCPNCRIYTHRVNSRKQITCEECSVCWCWHCIRLQGDCICRSRIAKKPTIKNLRKISSLQVQPPPPMNEQRPVPRHKKLKKFKSLKIDISGAKRVRIQEQEQVSGIEPYHINDTEWLAFFDEEAETKNLYLSDLPPFLLEELGIPKMPPSTNSPRHIPNETIPNDSMIQEEEEEEEELSEPSPKKLNVYEISTQNVSSPFQKNFNFGDLDKAQKQETNKIADTKFEDPEPSPRFSEIQFSVPQKIETEKLEETKQVDKTLGPPPFLPQSESQSQSQTQTQSASRGFFQLSTPSQVFDILTPKTPDDAMMRNMTFFGGSTITPLPPNIHNFRFGDEDSMSRYRVSMKDEASQEVEDEDQRDDIVSHLFGEAATSDESFNFGILGQGQQISSGDRERNENQVDGREDDGIVGKKRKRDEEDEVKEGEKEAKRRKFGEK